MPRPPNAGATTRAGRRPAGSLTTNHFLCPCACLPRLPRRACHRRSPDRGQLPTPPLAHRFRKAHAQTIPGAIGHSGNLGDAEGHRGRNQDRGRAADLVEQGKYLNLGFHFFGNGLDHQIGSTRGIFDTVGKFQAGECGVGPVSGNFALNSRPRPGRCEIRSRRGAERSAGDLPESCDSPRSRPPGRSRGPPRQRQSRRWSGP